MEKWGGGDSDGRGMVMGEEIESAVGMMKSKSKSIYHLSIYPSIHLSIPT